MVPERVLSDVPLNGCFDASMLRCFDKLGNHKLGNHKLTTQLGVPRLLIKCFDASTNSATGAGMRSLNLSK